MDEEKAAHLMVAGLEEGGERRAHDTGEVVLDDIEREQNEPGLWLQGWTLEELKMAQDEDKNSQIHHLEPVSTHPT